MPGDVHNELSGGPFFGPVVQAGTIGSITFSAPTASVPVTAAVRDPRAVFASVLANGFSGRDWLVGRIDEFLERQSCGYLWVEADAGMGKTTLVAHLARSRGWISHFARYANGGSTRVALQNLAGQLISRYELWELAPDHAVPEWAFTPEGFEALLAHAADGDRRVVLLVDGADEAVTAHDAQPWGLPSLLPDGVFVVGTYRTGAPPARSEAPQTVVRLAADDPRNQQDVLDHLRRAVLEDGLTAVDPQALAARCGGVWVYLRYVLDEIRLGLRRPDDLGDLPGDLRSYYLAQLGGWREDAQWRDVVLPLLATLAAAGEALPLDALSRFSGADEQHVQRWCHGRLRPFLGATTSSPRRFEIYHASLREMLTGASGDSEREQAWSEVLAPAVLAAHNRVADRCLTEIDESGYALRHLAAHLLTAGRGADLDALLCEENDGRPRWFTAHEEADTLDLYIADLETARAEHAARTDSAVSEGRVAPGLLQEIRCLLMIASLTSLTGTISVELLLALTWAGVWSPRRVLSHARRQPTPSARALVLAAVSPHLPAELRDEVLTEAVALLDTVEWPEDRCRTSAALAAHLAEDQIARTLADALSLSGQGARAAVLTGLSPHLSAGQLAEAFTAVLTLSDETVKSFALEGLAPHLSADQLDMTLTAVAGMTYWHEQQTVLEAIEARLDARQLDEALTITRAAEDGRWRVWTMARLIGRLPEDQRPQWTAKALAEAAAEDGTRKLHATSSLAAFLTEERLAELRAEVDAVSDDEDRAALLASLVPHLPAGQREDVVAEVSELCARLYRRGPSILASLAPHLPPDDLARALSAALTDWDDLTGSDGDVDLVLELAPHLTPELLDVALEGVDRISPEESQCELLVGLVPLLSADQLTRAAELAGEHLDAGNQVQALVAIAPHLPTRAQQRSAVEAALAAAVGISTDADRIDAATMLVPHVDATGRPALLAEIVERLAHVFDRQVRGRTLVRIAGHLTADELVRLLDLFPDSWTLVDVARQVAPEAAARILDIAIELDVHTRAEALSGLAPLLPPAELARALVAAREIDVNAARAKALTGIAPHVSAEARPAVVADALAALLGDIMIDDETAVALLPQLSTVDQLKVLDARGRVHDTMSRCRVLSELALLLPDEELPRVEAALRSIKHTSGRALVHGALARRAPPSRRPTAYAAVLTETKKAVARDRQHDFDLLYSLLPHVPAELHEQALDVVGAVREEDIRAFSFEQFAPHLRPDLVDAVMAMAESITDTSASARMRVSLLPHLSAERGRDVLAVAVENIAAHVPDSELDRELERLAPHLPVDLLFPALDLFTIGPTAGVTALLDRAAALGAHQHHLEILRFALRVDDRTTGLRILNGCLPTLCALAGPGAGTRLKEILDDVHRWWP